MSSTKYLFALFLVLSLSNVVSAQSLDLLDKDYADYWGHSPDHFEDLYFKEWSSDEASVYLLKGDPNQREYCFANNKLWYISLTASIYDTKKYNSASHMVSYFKGRYGEATEINDKKTGKEWIWRGGKTSLQVKCLRIAGDCDGLIISFMSIDYKPSGN